MVGTKSYGMYKLATGKLFLKPATIGSGVPKGHVETKVLIKHSNISHKKYIIISESADESIFHCVRKLLPVWCIHVYCLQQQENGKDTTGHLHMCTYEAFKQKASKDIAKLFEQKAIRFYYSTEYDSSLESKNS